MSAQSTLKLFAAGDFTAVLAIFGGVEKSRFAERNERESRTPTLVLIILRAGETDIRH